MPGAMGTQNLPRACGSRRAKELCFTGKSFSAQEALDWGMINAIYPEDDLFSQTLETAKLIAANAPIANRQAKKAINAADELDIQQGYTFEIGAYNKLLSTKDRIEGINAFNEKRNPQFTGQERE